MQVSLRMDPLTQFSHLYDGAVELADPWESSS